MARRDLNAEEERRSYAGVWAFSAALLLVGTIWALLDDSFLRRPWKYFQHAFYDLESTRASNAVKAEEESLAGHGEYQDLQKQLAAARQDLEGGEAARKIAAAEAKLVGAKTLEHDADIAVRFVKSELEEAWYEYDHAIESGGNVAAAREHRDELIARKAKLEAEWKATQDKVAALDAEIAEIRAPAKQLEDKIKEVAAERERLQVKLEGMKSELFGVKVPRIAAIQQVVLENFDRNNFDQPIARVDRCTSCHGGIDKPGFDDVENPFKTHPHRDVFLAKHPTDKFGCTPCHEGQGVALNSVEQAHGDVEFWQYPLLQGAKTQARCLGCHRDVSLISHAPTVRQGELLFEQLGCHGCHLVQGYETLEPVGPNLRRVAAKVDPAWMVAWVQDPHQFRPRTKMPNFLLSKEESTAAAAYIWQSSKKDGDEWLAAHPDPGGIGPDDADQVAAGKALFSQVGCRACHAISPDEIATPLGASKDYAPNLGRVGEKETARFVYWWIKDPRGYSPTTRMPSLRLSDDEARSIAAYLVSLTPESARPDAPGRQASVNLEDPALFEPGKALVRKYGCYGCHAIPGMDAESRIGVELSVFGGKTLEELYFGNHTDIPRTWDDWTYHKLQNPRIYATEHVEQLMPNFKLADEDIVALRVWLAGRTERVPPMKYRVPDFDTRMARIQDGRRVIEKYNCFGCHQFEGQGGYIRRLYEENPTMAPPILTGEGAKVQPNWLFGFLKDPGVQTLRPWLKVRMPTFGLSNNEGTAIVEYFGAVSNLKDPFFHFDPALQSTPEMIATGKQLMSTEYFGCFACHVRGTETPAGPPEQWAPNLALAHVRLNPEWILKWVADPQALMPGTKMPSFYPGGPEDVFGGDEAKQIRAIRDYIMTLGRAGAPTQASGQPAAGGAGTPG